MCKVSNAAAQCGEFQKVSLFVNSICYLTISFYYYA